jgi:AraC-like DNA-binding protein
MATDDAPPTRRQAARHGQITFATDIARAFNVAPMACLASLQDGLIVASTRLLRSTATQQPTTPLVRTPDILALLSLGPLGSLSVDLPKKTPPRRYLTGKGGLLLADLSHRPVFVFDNPFDLVAVLIPRALLARMSGRRTFALMDRAPVVEPDAPDAAMPHLAESLAAGFANPATVSAPFVDNVLLAITVHVSRTYGDDRAARRVSGGMTESTLKRAMDMLRANLASKATLGQIAVELGMSEGHFARTFKQTTGYSPHHWSMIQRCELAKTLLRSGTESFARIAMQAGFTDPAHFSRSFRQIVGVTPRQWRDGMIDKAT